MKKSYFNLLKMLVLSLSAICILTTPVSAGTIYIDAFGDGIPDISGDVWPDSKTTWNANEEAWFLSISVSGAHRSWPTPYKFVLTDYETDEVSMALQLTRVNYSDLRSRSWYEGYLYGLDQDGNYLEPDINWAEGTYGSANAVDLRISVCNSMVTC
jgi:hypothetical protein